MPVIHRWKEATSPFQFEYSRDALEQIRQLAVEGLLMLPRVGIGVGGLLLGTREGQQVRILDSVPIPCEHSTGPGFVLSAEETAAAVSMVRTASPLFVVGWYGSKTRGALTLSDTDERLFKLLCPESWQLAMLVRPSTSENSPCVFFYRDKSGNIVPGEERPLALDLAEEPVEPVRSEEPGNPVAAPALAETPRAFNKLWLAAAILLIVGAVVLLLLLR